MKTRMGIWKIVGWALVLGAVVLVGPKEARSANDWLKLGGDLLKQATGQSGPGQTSGGTSLMPDEIVRGLKGSLAGRNGKGCGSAGGK